MSKSLLIRKQLQNVKNKTFMNEHFYSIIVKNHFSRLIDQISDICSISLSISRHFAQATTWALENQWPLTCFFYHNDRLAVLLILFFKVSPYYLFPPLFRLHEGDFSNSFGSIRQPGWKSSLIFVFEGLIFEKKPFNSIFESFVHWWNVVMKIYFWSSDITYFFHRIESNQGDFKWSFRMKFRIVNYRKIFVSFWSLNIIFNLTKNIL